MTTSGSGLRDHFTCGSRPPKHTPPPFPFSCLAPPWAFPWNRLVTAYAWVNVVNKTAIFPFHMESGRRKREIKTQIQCLPCNGEQKSSHFHSLCLRCLLLWREARMFWSTKLQRIATLKFQRQGLQMKMGEIGSTMKPRGNCLASSTPTRNRTTERLRSNDGDRRKEREGHKTAELSLSYSASGRDFDYQTHHSEMIFPFYRLPM
jgi:hypothetical protein